jgi:hypothetical protein
MAAQQLAMQRVYGDDSKQASESRQSPTEQQTEQQTAIVID